MSIKSWRAFVFVVFAAATTNAVSALAAPDAGEVANRLAAAVAATGDMKATYDDATASGDTITISGLKIIRSDAKNIVIPSVVITGAAMREPGGFTAASIAFDGGTAKRGGDIVSWKTGMVEDAVVPSAEEIKTEADIRPFAKLVVDGLNIVESNLAKPVTADEIRVVLDSDAEGHPTAFAAQIGGIQFGADVLADRPQEKAIVDALGYEDFNVNIAVAGAFDRENDAISLDTFTINTANVGTVSIKARITGLSPGKIVATRLDAKARSEAKLDKLDIRFDNAGVVERALDMHAALIWGTRDDAVAQVNAALPLVLHFLHNDAFQAKVASAVQTFLANPQSISFTAQPAEPISLEQILKTSRASLPDVLGADVKAN